MKSVFNICLKCKECNFDFFKKYHFEYCDKVLFFSEKNDLLYYEKSFCYDDVKTFFVCKNMNIYFNMNKFLYFFGKGSIFLEKEIRKKHITINIRKSCPLYMEHLIFVENNKMKNIMFE